MKPPHRAAKASIKSWKNSLPQKTIRVLRQFKTVLFGSKPLPDFAQPLLQRFVRPLLPPRIIIISLTYDCQANCKHCGVVTSEKQAQELTTLEVMEIIDQVAVMGTGTIYFSGGEPLLRRDFARLVRAAVDRRCRVQFDTNGLLLDGDLARQLKACNGEILVGVSLDSPERQAHDRHRGVEGIFDAALSAIEHCVCEEIPVDISYYLTRDAFARGELEDTIRLGRELSVDGVRIITPALSGRLIERHDLAFLPQEELELMKRLKAEEGFAFLEHRDVYTNHRCPSFDMELIYISPYGDIQPCIYVPTTFGNLREEPLTSILKRMWRDRIFKGENVQCLAHCNRPFRSSWRAPGPWRP